MWNSSRPGMKLSPRPTCGLLCCRHSPGGFDRHDAEDLVVGSLQDAGVEPKQQAPVVGRESAVATGRVLDVPDRP